MKRLIAEWWKRGGEKVEKNLVRMKLRAKARKAVEARTIAAEAIDEIFAGQKGRCAYCRDKLRRRGLGKFHIDHIVPIAAGGVHERANLQLACPGCNLKKGAKDPLAFARSLGRLV